VTLALTDGISTAPHIIGFSSISLFKAWLDTNPIASDLPIPESIPREGFIKVVCNATTSTALTASGEVYTWTHDARYPQCLGRRPETPEHASLPHPIAYLSETKIIDIASGGYMSAALSKDGELFLWGQSCPGIAQTLDILERKNCNDDDQDDFVNV